jgi:hypothetical protein
MTRQLRFNVRTIGDSADGANHPGKQVSEDLNNSEPPEQSLVSVGAKRNKTAGLLVSVQCDLSLLLYGRKARKKARKAKQEKQGWLLTVLVIALRPQTPKHIPLRVRG